MGATVSASPIAPRRTTLRRAAAASLVLIGLVAVGCDPTATDARYWDRLPGDGAAVGQGGAGGAGTVGSGPSGTSDAAVTTTTGETSVTTGATTSTTTSTGGPDGDCASIAFTTVTYGGRYAPKNVGAVWITDDAGVFVRTLETWGHQRLKNAVAWRAASGGDDVDAITGATKTSHGPHTLTWDCRDATGQTRTAGAYQVHAEFTEVNSAEGKPPGPHRIVPIDVSVPGAANTPDDDAFVAMSVVSRP